MPLPGSDREKTLLQEINKPQAREVNESEAQFLQEIKEPFDENALTETKKKRTRRNSRSK